MTADTKPGGARGWVLVTGASRGIGRAVALAVAALGHPLVLWARTTDDLASLAAEIRERWGTEVRVATVDVAQADQVDQAVTASLAGIDSLRAVVVNAGGGIWGSLADMDAGQWREVLGANLDGAFHTLKATEPLLRARPGSQIIGLASDSSYNSFPQRGAYCASKAGFLSLLETARGELRADGVRVTALVPSRVDTYFRGKQPGARPEALSMAEIADVVAMLFSVPSRVEIRELHLSSIHSTFGMRTEVCTKEAQDD
ncbi:SDR family NAD(P)-dependent oxidoreductase [Streptomyces wedmorensis]|uniref:SDR family NAD(P)-dependent oxidoreductase n=1 Tax=Streptomyces wedmorensis TaxID=43759 RepID=UPI0034293CE9